MVQLVGRSAGVGWVREGKPLGVEHVDRRSGAALLMPGGGHDQPAVCPAHAVHAAAGAEVVQQRVVAQAAVGLDRIGAELPPLVEPARALGHVQDRLVGRQQHAVGAVGVGGDLRDRPPRAGRIAPVHGLARLRERALAVVGIAEPDPAGGVHRQVVGLVERRAGMGVGDHLGRLAGSVAHHAPRDALAGVVAAGGVEDRAVGAAGRLPPHLAPTVGRCVAPEPVRADLPCSAALLRPRPAPR